jgi:hypothetical protein
MQNQSNTQIRINHEKTLKQFHNEENNNNVKFKLTSKQLQNWQMLTLNHILQKSIC